MKKLTKVYETYKNGVQQELHISCEVKSKKKIDDVSYEDFKIEQVFKTEEGVYRMDVSRLFGKAGLLIPLIDDIDWEEIYEETVIEQTEMIDE